MANLRQDRVPGPTLQDTSASRSEGAPTNGRTAAPPPVALSVHLYSSGNSGQAGTVSWVADSPAAALIIDVISASSGAPDPPRGALLVVRFADLKSALLAARRVQWALEGLADSGGSSVAASVAIHPVEEDLNQSAAWENVGPGQILLSHKVADAVQQVPGLALRPTSGGNWRELEWRSAGEPASFAADEQSILSLIRASGREDPLAGFVPPPARAVPAPEATAAAPQAPTGLGRSVLEDEPLPIWKKPWAMVSAGAVVLVIVAVVVIRAMAPSPRPSVIAPGSTAPQAGSSQVPTAAVPAAHVPSALEKPPASKPTGKSGKTPRKPEPQTEAPTETARVAPAGACDLTENEIPLSLQRAARLMSAGKLSDAQDAYQRLVGCPSAREKALEGLRQVKLRMGFQGAPN